LVPLPYSLKLDKLPDLTKIVVFTDGSSTGKHSYNSSGGCGILILEENKIQDLFNDQVKSNEDIYLSEVDFLALSGQIEGTNDSYKAELMGVWTALRILSCNTTFQINIRLDNQSVVKDFNKLRNNPLTFLKNLYRKTEFPIWKAIEYLMKKIKANGGSAETEWVKGHTAENLGNNFADFMASMHGTKKTNLTNLLKLPNQDDTAMEILPKYGKMVIETDLRAFIRSHYHTGFAINSMNNEWHKKNNNISNESRKQIDVNWDKTFQILHNSRRIDSKYGTNKTTTFRSYQMKLFHGVLPTIDVLMNRNYDTYLTDTCKRCNQERETNEHIWTCTEASEARKDIITRAKRILIEPFRKMSNKTPALAQELSIIIKVVNEIIPSEEHDNNDEEYEGLRTLLSLTHPYLNIEDSIDFLTRIKHRHLFRGIVPQPLILLIETFYNLIHKCNKIPECESLRIKELLAKEGAVKLVYTFVKRINLDGFEEIWKTRCKETVEWEKRNRINKKMKRQTSQNPHQIPTPKNPKLNKTTLSLQTQITVQLQYQSQIPLNKFFNSSVKVKWKAPPKENNSVFIMGEEATPEPKRRTPKDFEDNNRGPHPRIEEDDGIT
jgi:ribonuclease HI